MNWPSSKKIDFLKNYLTADKRRFLFTTKGHEEFILRGLEIKD
jgi:hypothetical protein